MKSAETRWRNLVTVINAQATQHVIKANQALKRMVKKMMMSTK